MLLYEYECIPQKCAFVETVANKQINKTQLYRAEPSKDYVYDTGDHLWRLNRLRVSQSTGYY